MYKCVICGRKVDDKKASRKMKKETVCFKCLMEYVIPKGGKNENKMDK